MRLSDPRDCSPSPDVPRTIKQGLRGVRYRTVLVEAIIKAKGLKSVPVPVPIPSHLCCSIPRGDSDDNHLLVASEQLTSKLSNRKNGGRGGLPFFPWHLDLALLEASSGIGRAIG